MSGQVIIVTGSATGIGRAIARRLAEEGARILIHDKNAEGLHNLERELGAQSRAHVDDLADPTAAKRIVDAAISAFDRLDGLVNNAAFVNRANIETTTTELFDRIMAVNVRAPLMLIKAALPHLTATRGCVLNIGSINAYAGEEGMLPYSMSKGALQTMTRNLGDSLHRRFGVRVNQINPGWVLTENERKYQRQEGMPDDWPSRLPEEFNPSGTLIAPETIAEAAAFWISDRSRPVSASVVDMEQFPMIGRNPSKYLKE